MFAVLADVKRVLRIPAADTTNDDELSAALEAANDLVSRKVRMRYLPGTRTYVTWNVPADGYVPLPAEEVVVTAVEDDWGSIIDWHVEGDGVRLGGNFGGMGVAEARSLRTYYDKLTITYTGLSTVPAALREATALLAAELYPEVIQSQGSILSEKLGDYGYTRSAKEEGGVSYRQARARELLAPYIDSGQIFVV